MNEMVFSIFEIHSNTMKQYIFKNNAGEKKAFEANSLFEAKELAIEYFQTFLVYPCHFELNANTRIETQTQTEQTAISRL
jgi:hypothetical protein